MYVDPHSILAHIQVYSKTVYSYTAPPTLGTEPVDHRALGLGPGKLDKQQHAHFD